MLGVVQLVLVLSLGGKLLYDRMTRPRVWVQGAVYDPDLPIRGRYLGQRIRFAVEGFSYSPPGQPDGNGWFQNRVWAYWEVRNNQLIAKAQGSGPGGWVHLQRNTDNTIMATSDEPVLVFLPESAVIPTLRPDEELWLEVTVPAKGPPRPIRIGIKKNGVVTPLKFD